MKLCLFSVGYAGLWGQDRLSLDDLAPRARRLGYGSLMLMSKRPHLSPLDATPERIAELKRRFSETGIDCDVIGGYTDFACVGAPEVPHLELQIAYVESLARIGKALGAGVVRVFTSYEVPGLAFHTLWDRTVTALRECCDRAAAYGMTIAVQNHHDVGVSSSVLEELLSDIGRPNCKLGFDAWSPALRGEDLYETSRRLAKHVVCTTNADYVRLPRYRYQPELVNYAAVTPDAVRAVPFGDGFIDYEAFFKGLHDGGFDGIATYEMCSPLRGGGALANLDMCAARYVTWMKEHRYS